MVDESAPKEEEPQALTEPNADAADKPTIPQPRPTAWVTGGGALTYARAAATPNADAEDLDPAPQEEASTDGGLDDDAATDSDSESDGDEAAWAMADGLAETSAS